MIQLLLAFGPLPISLFVVTGMWLLIKWAGRARKHSKKLKAKIKKMENDEYAFDEWKMYN